TAPSYSNDIKSKLYQLYKGPGDWPDFLQRYLGNEYKVINSGVSGENTLGIMLRQGSLPLLIGKDILFCAKQGIVTHIASKNDSLFEGMMGGGNSLLLHGWEHNTSARFNPCVINDREYNIHSISHPYKNSTSDSLFSWLYDYYIEPLGESQNRGQFCDVDTIAKGSRIYTWASQHLRNPYINIFFIGQNGGYSSINELISQIKTMINYSNAKRYIVISFHHTNNIVRTIPEMKRMEQSYYKTFGQNYINLRDSLIHLDFYKEGFTLTREDSMSVRNGKVPQTLMKDGLHFNPEVYDIIARMIFNKIKQ
ncbi:MAG: hypothetical protein J5965_19270, partial [Aeriscardovia sp.]|nr:hypothetical protein [Aeriscardovia sp.]